MQGNGIFSNTRWAALMRLTCIPFALVLLGLDTAAAQVVFAEPASPDAAKLDFFEKRVRPILVNNCYNCHSANTNSKGSLRVDDRNGLLNGGNEGPAIVPGEPEKSRLIRAV